MQEEGGRESERQRRESRGKAVRRVKETVGARQIERQERAW